MNTLKNITNHKSVAVALAAAAMASFARPSIGASLSITTDQNLTPLYVPGTANLGYGIVSPTFALYPPFPHY
jgi:hypothetical protein